MTPLWRGIAWALAIELAAALIVTGVVAWVRRA